MSCKLHSFSVATRPLTPPPPVNLIAPVMLIAEHTQAHDILTEWSTAAGAAAGSSLVLLILLRLVASLVWRLRLAYTPRSAALMVPTWLLFAQALEHLRSLPGVRSAVKVDDWTDPRTTTLTPSWQPPRAVYLCALRLTSTRRATAISWLLACPTSHTSLILLVSSRPCLAHVSILRHAVDPRD